MRPARSRFIKLFVRLRWITCDGEPLVELDLIEVVTAPLNSIKAKFSIWAEEHIGIVWQLADLALQIARFDSFFFHWVWVDWLYGE